MKKISIIIPVHKIDNEYSTMLKMALNSVEDFHNDVDVLIVTPHDINEQLSDKLSIEIVKNTGNSDFVSQVNLGINKCKTEWFSILEIDDVYHTKWLNIVNSYMNENPEVDVFLPIVKEVDTDGKIIGLTNETLWAYGFTEHQGLLDNEILLDFQNFQTSGGLYRTETIKEYGLFKDNIKLTFSYEFLLRLTHNGVMVMGIPKIGYQHVNMRKDSLYWNYKFNEDMKITENEVKFWTETAKKEFFFMNKRDVIYQEK